MVDDSNTEKLSLDLLPKERLLNASLLIGIDLDCIVTMFTDLRQKEFPKNVNQISNDDIEKISKTFNGIKTKFKYIDLNNMSELDDMDYAFLCANFLKCSSTIETILKYFGNWHQFIGILSDIQKKYKRNIGK